MKKTQQEILQRFDSLFEYKTLSLPDGWCNILWKLLSVVEHNNPPSDFKILQVKEKFGTLRIYCSNSTPEIDKFIMATEIQSGKICEQCGMPGELRKRMWVKTLCETHNK